MEIISDDLSRHYSIESLAAPFGISPSSLKNYFQGVYGKNISTWLREARMSVASAALREGNQPVAEIAASVGYENASKFSAAFKSFLGATPLEYRRQSRGCGCRGNRKADSPEYESGIWRDYGKPCHECTGY